MDHEGGALPFNEGQNLGFFLLTLNQGPGSSLLHSLLHYHRVIQAGFAHRIKEEKHVTNQLGSNLCPVSQPTSIPQLLKMTHSEVLILAGLRFRILKLNSKESECCNQNHLLSSEDDTGVTLYCL